MKIDRINNLKKGFPLIQDQAYDLFGEMLLEQEAQDLMNEIEAEKGTEAEKEMNDFFACQESRHLKDIAKCFSRYKMQNRKVTSVLSRLIQIAAVLVVCLGLIGGAALATNSTFRIYIMKMLAEHTPEYTEITLEEQLQIDIPENWQGLYYPTQLPSDAFVLESWSNESYSQVLYARKGETKGWKLWFSEYDETFDVRIDTEDTDEIQMEINGNEATLAVKDELTSVYWSDGQRIIVLQTQNVPVSETLEYAEKVRLIKLFQ